MAVVKGVREEIHLPLYDSVFVPAKEQLGNVENSNILKFFVNVQGKTKLETNMQSSSLLPHWNTFEARALRVVISDLPAVFPEEIEQCLTEQDGIHGSEALIKLQDCIDQLCDLIEQNQREWTNKTDCLEPLQEYAGEFEYWVNEANEIGVDLEGCLGFFRALADQDTLGHMLDLQAVLKNVSSDISNVMLKTRIRLSKPDDVQLFIKKLKSLPSNQYEKVLLKQFKHARSCFDSFSRVADLVKKWQGGDVKKLKHCIDNLKAFSCEYENPVVMIEQIKQCLIDVKSEIIRTRSNMNSERTRNIQACLNDRLENKRETPINAQLSGNGTEMLSKLVYNSITTFSVGEKIMMQMPTWFFPSGAGPYSEDGNVVTHGFPSPEATFRFAGPVFIDSRQHFNVEIEIPESFQLNELQRLYGPFFIWVVLDGYMVRDVQ